MHPESKKRLEVLGLKSSKVESGEKYLSLVHDKYYIKQVKEACKVSDFLDADTAISKKSYEAAVMAVGATVQASEEGGFALVRPPGHHAHPGRSSGFCIFNSLAISVKNLVRKKKRVLIFDFDGHLGDGTEKIFYDSDKVFYFSLHQFPAFPGHGWVDEIGEGKGEGYTLNVPLPEGTGDDLYLKAIDKFLWILKKFNPDVVAISAGFDGYKSDSLLELNLSVGIYYEIGKIIRNNFENSYATLEGGYNVDVLKDCVNNFLNGMNGEEIYKKDEATKSSSSVKKEFDRRMKLVEKNINKYWK
ncbi:histone deacetylase [Candidatus Pacearchaeota archaeon]|nr:histone deacetylase [Candidatus Pacearchaeota archaeon]